jgi:hypothetical protein
MKKYLKEIENAAYILLLIGLVAGKFLHYKWGTWTVFIGLGLWLIQLVYKAFNWQEFASDNKKNIGIMMIAILILFIKMLFR